MLTLMLPAAFDHLLGLDPAPPGYRPLLGRPRPFVVHANFLAQQVSLSRQDRITVAEYLTRESMKENLFPELGDLLAQHRREAGQPDHRESQPFDVYRLRRRPARVTAWRRVIYVSRVGELSAAQESIVADTEEYLGILLDLPVHRGADLNPDDFAEHAIRENPLLGRRQLQTGYLINEAMGLDRPEDALICLAVTALDLWSTDTGDRWGSVYGEAFGGHAGAWSLFHLGRPDRSADSARRCLKRSCIVAAHEALHVLGLDHCTGLPCIMRGPDSLSGPLNLCLGCLRKLCWNRQFELLPYLDRMRRLFDGWGLHEEAEQIANILSTPSTLARRVNV